MKDVIYELLRDRNVTIREEKDDMIFCDELILLFSNDNKININFIKYCIQLLDQNDKKHIIIIYNGNITSSVKKIVELSDDLEIELINECLVKYNITKHKLVPKHILVTEGQEKQDIMKVGINKIPIILLTDPIVKWYNWKTGNIIRIERNDNTISYRVVK